MRRLRCRHHNGSFGFQLERGAGPGRQQSHRSCYKESQYGSCECHSNALNIQRSLAAGQVTILRGMGSWLAKSPKRLNFGITRDGSLGLGGLAMSRCSSFTRRSALTLLAGTTALPMAQSWAEEQVITVHKDPNCGCCTSWAEHLQRSGFAVKIMETKDLDAVKERLGVPPDLAACHTAQIAGYVVEGHVPALALQRFLKERSSALGLAVPGMPIGSPGMEGGTPEVYEVILFGKRPPVVFDRFKGDRPA